MPSLVHDAPLTVLREDPSVIATLLRDVVGMELPAFEQADLSDPDFTQAVPAEFRADLGVCLRGGLPARAPVLGIVVEIQRRRDHHKSWTWPLYLAALHARLRCRTCLVVVAMDDATAAWAATPIQSLHPGTSITPVVFGPAQIPRVTAPEAVERPWLAVLSAVAHGKGPDGIQIALDAIAGLARLPDVHATVGYDLIYASLGAAGRRALEDQMQPYKYEYQSDFARRYFGEGREKGLEEGREKGRSEAAATLRTVLAQLALQRLGDLSEAQRAVIEGCGDLELLGQVTVAIAAATDAESARRALAELGAARG